MTLRSWGNYPRIACNVVPYDRVEELRDILRTRDRLISYGNGRSYGDSALGKNILRARSNHFFLGFDESSGLLHLQSSVVLADILDVFVPRGWFLAITPGTKYITVGGAIASDVHGKNHHLAGCFSECVRGFDLMLPTGEIVACSRTQHAELFRATCGGMGLTGVILDVKLYLQKIRSAIIRQTVVKARNLTETFEAFERYRAFSYSVAWIDCLAGGAGLGRSLLTLGEFCDEGGKTYRTGTRLRIGTRFPGVFLHPFSVRAFNALYYRKGGSGPVSQRVSIDRFFYPLDAIDGWNNLYGRNGFTQYQFILPLEASYQGIREILAAIADHGRGSFLAVLKLYGPANDNYLSFPMEGYSLALDFRIERGLFPFLQRLDEIVLAHGGRLYLAKDARVSRATFEKGYPRIETFRLLRERYGMKKKFNSRQSQRVGI
jgi:decaprenylphospho-beta-D-ribofuranose 2-oxidase